jgi:hypothetical protein
LAAVYCVYVTGHWKEHFISFEMTIKWTLISVSVLGQILCHFFWGNLCQKNEFFDNFGYLLSEMWWL